MNPMEIPTDRTVTGLLHFEELCPLIRTSQRTVPQADERREDDERPQPRRHRMSMALICSSVAGFATA